MGIIRFFPISPQGTMCSKLKLEDLELILNVNKFRKYQARICLYIVSLKFLRNQVNKNSSLILFLNILSKTFSYFFEYSLIWDSNDLFIETIQNH